MKFIEFKDVCKNFGDISILKNIDFVLPENSSTAIIGKSGSGKSTFLHLAGGLDVTTSGDVFCCDLNWKGLKDKYSSKLRNTQIGFIFQSNLLLEDFTVLENVMMASLINGLSPKNCKERAVELLTKLGLQERLNHKASKLSGGEKQRVAICRALMNKPKVILADEPTGSLDENNSSQVEDLLLNLVKDEGCSLLLVSHNNDFAYKCDNVYLLTQGNLKKVK